MTKRILTGLDGRRWDGVLVGLLALGLGLRGLGLDRKPLWLDEVMTALLSSGQTFATLPLETWVPLPNLAQLFAFRPLSCPALAAAINADSTHPPLFFCLMHQWLGWWQPDLNNLSVVLRSPAVIAGVLLIAIAYGLGCQAFSRAVGRVSAALMAVSPFAVYLSQEARHYTLPMVWIALGTWCVLHIQQRLHQGKSDLRGPLALWAGISTLGLYTHYFVLLAIAAQGLTLLILSWRYRAPWPVWAQGGLAGGAIFLAYLPWLSALWGHTGRAETDWLTLNPESWSGWLAPIVQQWVAWIVMVIVFPLEGQPPLVMASSGVMMLLFIGCLGRWVGQGTRRLWQSRADRAALLTLGSILGLTLLALAGLVYGGRKDITLAPRYGFVYFPIVMVLLGAILHQVTRSRAGGRSHWWPLGLTLAVGVLSSCSVVWNLSFQKPFLPETVATTIASQSPTPITLVVGYNSMQEIGMGLGVALPLWRQLAPTPTLAASQLLFVERGPDFTQIWLHIAALPPAPQPLQSFWVIGSKGMRQQNYPPTITVAQTTTCQRQDDQYGYTGYSFQGYLCGDRGSG